MVEEKPFATTLHKAARAIDLSDLSIDGVADKIRQSLIEVSNGLIA